MLQVGRPDGRCFNGGNLRNALPPQRTGSPITHYPLPLRGSEGASSRETRRQVLQRREPPQRTASPTHWLTNYPLPITNYPLPITLKNCPYKL
ncbi:MAG: hypothetical protein KME31_20750 [Tolypothrix carrinoi HA7290-LM1]|nr:hypothetical protein [Tolypothrix carrinoi HA7290-LM1]